MSWFRLLAVSALCLSACSSSLSSAEASPTAADLVKVAAEMYPFQGFRYVACDNTYGGPSRYSRCPVTQRLNDRLTTVFSGFVSAPEPLGGAQDPEWAAQSISAEASGTGGVAHVALAKPNSAPSRYDLVIIRDHGKLLVDDLYCTGADPKTASIYVDGWMDRYQCA